MSDQEQEQSGDGRAARPKPNVSPRGKLVFVLVMIALMAVIYFTRQRGQTILPDWPDNIDRVLEQAAKEDRKVLALFMSSPPNQLTKQLADTTIHKNKGNIAKGKFLPVKIVVSVALTDNLSKRFNIKKLPTMLILSPAGEELNRGEGLIGQVDFGKGFLDLTKINKPQQPPT